MKLFSCRFVLKNLERILYSEMKKLVVLMLLAVVASGCASEGSSEPQQGETQVPEPESTEFSPEDQPSFSQLAQKAENSRYHVEYDYEGPGPLMYIGKPEVFSYDGVRMVARPGNMPGEGAVSYNVYYRDDIEVGCTEGSEELSGCNTMPVDVAPSTDHYSDRIERFNVTEKGLESKLGRECYMYRLEGGDFLNSYMDICLDAEKGFVSFLDMKAEGSGRTVMDMNATGYDLEVSPENVRPPVKAVPRISCYQETVNITTTDYSGAVKFQVNDGENRTVEMSEWSVETVDVSQNMEEGENTVEAYVGDTKDSSFCRN